jgi:hypothetical protein
MPVEEGKGAMLLGVVKNNPLLEVLPSHDKLSKTQQSFPQHQVSPG